MFTLQKQNHILLYNYIFFSFYVKIKRTQVTDRGKPVRIIIFLGLGSDTIPESLVVYHSR
jgi:hypothetical protein